MTKIYLIQKNNIPIYVGKTKNISVRLFYHRKKFGNDITYFYLDEVSDSEWKFWEKHYISLFRSWGFKLENKNDGGGGSTSYSDEIKQKISQSKTGMKYNLTEEGKINKSILLKGLKRSEKTKQKISKAKKGHECYKNPERNQKIRKNNSNNKPIYQYDLQGNLLNEFQSAQEAGRHLGKSGNSIADCAAGRQKTAYGFIWEYKTQLI